jgi:hypothetical protein
MRALKHIKVDETPLQEPKLTLALRGINAIKEYFEHWQNDN